MYPGEAIEYSLYPPVTKLNSNNERGRFSTEPKGVWTVKNLGASLC